LEAAADERIIELAKQGVLDALEAE